MATTYTLELDTSPPTSPTVSIDGGAAFSGDHDVVLTLGITGADAAQVKIYGDVDDAFATSEYRAAEANAPWVSWATSKNVRLSAGDGAKTVRIKVRDDVLNVSTEGSDAITVDTSLPVPNITTAPDRTKISKQATRDTSTFGWQSDVVFDEYKVKIVASTGAAHSTGVQVPTAGGSSNVAGNAGGYPATTTITTAITGTDLESADAGDGNKIVKVFVKDAAGNWSV
jgi:hypothetical protein